MNQNIINNQQFSGHQLTENVKLLQKAVLKHGDKFLILQRSVSAQSRPMMWDLPGGNSEWPKANLEIVSGKKENINELHRNDISREILEETGIDIKPNYFNFEKMISFRTFFEAEKQVFSVITGWVVDLSDNFDEKIVQISDEHMDKKWISIAEVENYDFGGVKGEFIVEMIENLY